MLVDLEMIWVPFQQILDRFLYTSEKIWHANLQIVEMISHNAYGQKTAKNLQRTNQELVKNHALKRLVINVVTVPVTSTNSSKFAVTVIELRIKVYLLIVFCIRIARPIIRARRSRRMRLPVTITAQIMRHVWRDRFGSLVSIATILAGRM